MKERETKKQGLKEGYYRVELCEFFPISHIHRNSINKERKDVCCATGKKVE